MADIQRYLDRVESQHRTKPRFMATLEAVLTPVDDVCTVIKDMPRLFHVKEAVGAQLDIDGGIVGVDRRFPPIQIPGLPATLDDETFRKILLSRIVQNQWDGTNETFISIWKDAVGDYLDASYYDNQDMSMDVHITGQTEPALIEMILRGYIIPKPMGVGVNVKLTDGVYADGGEPIKTGSVVTLDDLHAGIRNHIDIDSEDEEILLPGAVVAYNTAGVGIRNHLDITSEAEDNINQGCRAFANQARIAIPNTIPEEQTETEPMNTGARATANIAHFAVVIK